MYLKVRFCLSHTEDVDVFSSDFSIYWRLVEKEGTWYLSTGNSKVQYL